MACGERGNPYRVDGMRSIKINCFNERERREMVMFGIKRRPLVRGRRCVANSHVILNQPFVDRFSCMRHKDSTFEISLA